MPVSSLPSNYGIGTLGKDAFKFVDFLKAAGQTYWQVLPVCPTSYGDSPYQSFSTFAGNPYFIDIDLLIDEGLLTKSEADSYDFGSDKEAVDYGKLFESRFELLKRAFSRSSHKEEQEYIFFHKEYAENLDDYCFFMSLKFYFDNLPWTQWDDDIRLRKPKALLKYREALAEDIDFWWFLQYKFFSQWNKLKEYANSLGIEIVGDLPIYVAMDSADTWTDYTQFLLDYDRKPIDVAGVPPDYFSATGQLWGNPLYDWDKMEQNNFAWWKRRMSFCANLYDIIRIDHFIGFVRYYAIPAEDDTAMGGEYREGPGIKLLDAIGEVIGSKKIIAEDLGVVPPAVVRLLAKTGYPGMKVLMFGLDENPENSFLPHNYERNCVVYGGTHDNDTLRGYYDARPPRKLRHTMEYLNVKRKKDLVWATIKAGFMSVADTVIFQMQDYLELPSKARMNYPSTLGGNWEWRSLREDFSDELAQRILTTTKTYARTTEAKK